MTGGQSREGANPRNAGRPGGTNRNAHGRMKQRAARERNAADHKSQRFFLLALKLLDLSAESARDGDHSEAQRRLREAHSVTERLSGGRATRRMKNRVRQRAQEVAARSKATTSSPKVTAGRAQVKIKGAQPIYAAHKKRARVLLQKDIKDAPRCVVCGIADPTLPKSKDGRTCAPCRRAQRGAVVLQAGAPGLGRRGR